MDKNVALGNIPLFANLTGTDLEKLSEIAREVVFDKGKRVFEEGSIGDSLYLIVSGSVRVLKKGRAADEEVTTLGPGEHFGEMAIIDEGLRSATIEAIERTHLIQIKRADLEHLLATDLDMAYKIYSTMAKYLCLRLRQTTYGFASKTELQNFLLGYMFQH